MMLSSILDIGSFFIGMIINLLLVTLMCYYFKKKYESLEEAQNEQAKILYELLRARNQTKHENTQTVNPISSDMKVHVVNVSDESDDDSVESAESEIEEYDMGQSNEVKVLTLDIPIEPDNFTVEKSIEPIIDTDTIIDIPTEDIVEVPTEIMTETPTENPHLIIEISTEDEFSKMTMKQLRDILTEKGVKVKPNMKKNELIELAKL